MIKPPIPSPSAPQTPADQTRLALVRAALKLFGSQGFDGTSTREIAAAAKANIGSIAYHFGGKDGLKLAAADYIVETIQKIASQAMAGLDAPKPLPVLTFRRTTAHDLGRILAELHGAAVGNGLSARRAGLTRHEARLALGLLLSAAEGENVGLLRPSTRVPLARKEGWTTKVRHTAAIAYGAHGPRMGRRPWLEDAALEALDREPRSVGDRHHRHRANPNHRVVRRLPSRCRYHPAPSRQHPQAVSRNRPSCRRGHMQNHQHHHHHRRKQASTILPKPFHLGHLFHP